MTSLENIISHLVSPNMLGMYSVSYRWIAISVLSCHCNDMVRYGEAQLLLLLARFGWILVVRVSSLVSDMCNLHDFR